MDGHHNQTLARALRHLCDGADALKALIADFLTVGALVLHGSWGRMRHIKPGKPRLGRIPQEDVMPYGNDWITECLDRAVSDDWSALSLDGSN